MKKTFKEVLDEIKAGVTVTEKGKVKKTFSRTDFDKLAVAFLNETGHTVEVASTKDGKMVTKEVKPIALYRNMVIPYFIGLRCRQTRSRTYPHNL